MIRRFVFKYTIIWIGELTSLINELVDIGTLLFIVNWPIKQID
jgi:hypothetical protein